MKICPGADPAHFRPGLDASELVQRLGFAGRPALLTVSRIVKANRYKGHDVVLRALPEVVRAFPDVAYVIAGDGDDRDYLSRLAAEYGVQKNVIFAGRVSDAELPLLYNACDAFIMCSREESHPSRHSGRRLRDRLAGGIGLRKTGDCGTLRRHRRRCARWHYRISGKSDRLAEEVAAAIVRLLQEPALADRLGQNGRHWVESEMNWTRAADEFQRAMEFASQQWLKR